MVYSHNRFLENGLWHWNLWSSGHWNCESIHFLLSDWASQRLRNHLQRYCHWIARAFSEGKETTSLFAVEESWLALPTVECIVQDQRFRCLHFPIFQCWKGSKGWSVLPMNFEKTTGNTSQLLRPFQVDRICSCRWELQGGVNTAPWFLDNFSLLMYSERGVT